MWWELKAKKKSDLKTERDPLLAKGQCKFYREIGALSRIRSTHTSTLEFKDARTTVACILRSFFRVVSPSARLHAQHASRHIAAASLRNMRGGLPRARGRRGRGTPGETWRRDARRRGAAAELRVVSSRLSRVATSPLPRTARLASRTRFAYAIESIDSNGEESPAIVSLKIKIDKVTCSITASVLRRRFSDFGWFRESLREFSGVLRGPKSILRTLSEYLRILGEVCETRVETLRNTLKKLGALWDISHNFKAFSDKFTRDGKLVCKKYDKSRKFLRK